LLLVPAPMVSLPDMLCHYVRKLRMPSGRNVRPNAIIWHAIQIQKLNVVVAVGDYCTSL
jgi:hypothetical protein